MFVNYQTIEYADERLSQLIVKRAKMKPMFLFFFLNELFVVLMTVQGLKG